MGGSNGAYIESAGNGTKDLDSVSKRKQYSKNGCRECKRRKIKCTEEKPHCLRCTRLNKSCSYPAVGEKVLRVSKRFLRENPAYYMNQEESKSSLKIQQYPRGGGTNVEKESPTSEHSKESTPISELAPSSTNNNTNSIVPQQKPLYNPVIPPFDPTVQYQLQQQTFLQPLGTSQKPPLVLNTALTSNQYPFAPSSVPIIPSLYPAISAQPQAQPPPLSQAQPQPHPSVFQSTAVPGIVPSPGYVAPGIGPTVTPQANAYAVYDASRILPSRFPSYATSQYLLPKYETTATTQTQTPAASYLTPITQDSQSSEPSSGPLAYDADSIETLAESFYSQNDLNILAADLNNLVSDIMYELDDKFKEGDESLFNSAQWDLEISAEPPRIIPRNYDTESIKLSLPQERLYLEAFSAEFSGIVLPFCSYDKTLKTKFNPVRDILLYSANNEPCLLSALLAMGAKCVHSRTKLRSHEAAYCSYLSKCLKYLAKSVVVNPTTKYNDQRRNSLSADIEAVLLTVLLMTTFNAANIKQDWRPHLRGARDLLLRHTTTDIPNTKVFIFCKFWFIILEILAGISSKKGGTLKTDKDIDSLINVGTPYEQKVLQDLGILMDNGFNTLGGYSHRTLNYFRDYIKIMNRIRDRKQEAPNVSESIQVFSLLGTLYKSSEDEFVDVNCVFPRDDIKSASFLTDTVEMSGKKLSISWQDASHQGYTSAMIITLLTQTLQIPDQSSHIQFWSSRIANIVSIFDNNLDEIPVGLNKYALLMLQWPIRTAGLHSVDRHEYKCVELFFKLSSTVTGSAIYALKRVKAVWKKRADGTPIIMETDEELDTVSY